MKKILILTSVLLLTLFICKVPSKAASNLNITGFTKLEEGETYGEGYYIIHTLVQDDNVYDQDYEQFANYFTKNSNIEYCNLTPFYKSNVHDLLKSTFNMYTDETNANFLTEVREYSTRRFGACCMFYTLESFNYAYLEETCGEIGDLYRVNIEEGPNIAGSNTHIINYDNNITLEQIKSTYRATDNYDKDLTSQIVFESDYPTNPKDARVGVEYYITASVSDTAGNKTTVRDIIIVQDITKPVFHIDNPLVELKYRDDLSMNDIISKISCIDNYDGEILNSSWKYDKEIDFRHLGDQSLKITTTDSSENTAELQLTIRIIDDEYPVISVTPIEISTTNPLTEEEIVKMLVKSNEIDDNYSSYTLTSDYFNNQENIGSYDATLLLNYDDEVKTYRFKINVLEHINENNTNNYWYIYLIVGIVLVASIGGISYYIYKKKRVE